MENVKLLTETPAVMTRPLMLINDKAYASTWLPVQVTLSERVMGNKTIKYNPPREETEQWRFIIREDGQLFGPDGKVWQSDNAEELNFDVRLKDAPPAAKTWSPHGVLKYHAGLRPDPKRVFEKVVGVINRFIDFNRSLGDQHTMCQFMGCDILATYFLDALTVIGYTWPSGDRGTGKTQTLILKAEMGFLGQLILMGGSYATLRDMADYGACLCFDDAENLLDQKTDPDKRALLLAGNRKGAIVTVKEKGSNGEWRTRHVNAYCARSFSSIKLPDPVLESRSISIPLVRTSDRQRANSDPLDYSLWPHDRRELVDDLWALGLAHLSELVKYEGAVSGGARLSGRALQPWKAILAVAAWLDDKGVKGLFNRIEKLSWSYQEERTTLELTDLTTLVVRSLCHCANSAKCAINNVKPENMKIMAKTDEVTRYARQIAEAEDADPDWITNKRVGRVLSQLRLKEIPRPGGRGSRIRELTFTDLEGLCQTYSLPDPHTLFNGTNGSNGSMAQVVP